MRYRKKPIVIDADRWNPKSEGAMRLVKLHDWSIGTAGELYIPTLEGTMCASIGDWIIRGVNGEYYPCKPEIFEMTYEKADQ